MTSAHEMADSIPITKIEVPSPRVTSVPVPRPGSRPVSTAQQRLWRGSRFMAPPLYRGKFEGHQAPCTPLLQVLGQHNFNKDL